MSKLDIKLDILNFSLYLNGNFMGSNYDPFAQTTAKAFKVTAIDFVVPLQPSHLQHIKWARQQVIKKF